MGQYLQTDSIWNKLKNNIYVDYEDIEQYIYDKNHIKAFNDRDFNYDGTEYNQNLNKYSFEVEEYQSEADYHEIFFQSYIDGNISREKYLNCEKVFLDFMNILYDSGKTYAFYSLDTALKNKFPFKKSTDIPFDPIMIQNNDDKVFLVKDKNFFQQLCYLTAREIESVIFVFYNIKAVLLNSGLHGIILFEKPLDKSFEKKLSHIIKLSKNE